MIDSSLEPMLPPRPLLDTSLDALNEDSEPGSESLEAIEAQDGSGRLAAFVLLLCLAAFHVLANVWWLHEDNHTIRTDEEGHMFFARQYHEVLFVQDFPDPVRRLIAVSEIRPGIPAHPPLLHLLGALMIQAFGYSTDVIALSSTLLFVLLLLGCYGLARTFLGPWQSLFVVFVVSMTPIIFVSSRYFMTDYGSATIVVWALFALVRSQGLRHPGWSFFFAVLNGLGILTRTVTFAYFLLPAALAGVTGLFASLRREQDGTGLGTLATNLIMVLLVTVGIFGPWYYKNLEPFYDYWSNMDISGTRGPLANFTPSPAVSTAVTATPVSGTVSTPVGDQSFYARCFRTFSEKVVHPQVAWIRYPVYLMNQGLFATLAGLALLGMAIAPLRARFRSVPLAYLYLWPLGSWLFFTLILRSGTPRYGLPMAPGLAFFAALFVLALPGRWIRFTAASLLSVVLLFQFALLTFQPVTYDGGVGIPCSFPPAVKHHFTEQEVVIFKPYLALGAAYARLGAPEQENIQERLIGIMLKHERELPVRRGAFANYQKLNVRGLEFHERHYWPGDNPYRLPSLPAEQVPERRLTMIHMGTAPEHLLPLLADTDYIVYQAPVNPPETASSYVSFFEARGYALLETFDIPAFGLLPAERYGVLARKLEGELVPVTAESITAMSLYDIHALKYSADFQRLSQELRALAQSTFEAKLQAVATPFQLNDSVTFMTAETTRVDSTTYQFRLVFQVHKALDRNWRMLFHGFVAPENLPRLPVEKQSQGYVDWNFAPQPPTTEWVPGDYVILTHQIVAEPLAWQFKFGLFEGDTLFGRTALLQVMDLSAIP